MKRFLTLICALALVVAAVSHCDADIAALTVDPTNSNLDLSIAGIADSSPVSGTSIIDIQNCDLTGTAQFTALDFTLDAPLSFPIGLGVSGATQGGDLTVSLVTPGAAGTIAGGTFSQLGNQLALGGIVSITDILGIAGGNQTIDLSTLGLVPADFNNISVSLSGNVVTASGSFNISQDVDLDGQPGGLTIPLVASGQFIASGIKTVPEPGSTMVLIGIASTLLILRRR